MAPAASPASRGMQMLFMWKPRVTLTPSVGTTLLITSAFVSCRKITCLFPCFSHRSTSPSRSSRWWTSPWP
jgi:hypothetical protein